MTDDPRLDDQYVRRSEGETADGDVLLVGVVHDHPASRFRVRELVRTESPDVLALELAPLALPLFEQYASSGDEDSSTPPPLGGEMSAAIDAADTASVEAIDGPSRGFLRRLAAVCYEERTSYEDLRRISSRFSAISKHVLACRLAALAGRFRESPPNVHEPTAHETTWADSPEEQAADEHTQARKATAVLSAFESPTHARLRDETREAHMADRLETLRADGDVVAVVGLGHLEAVHERLER